MNNIFFIKTTEKYIDEYKKSLNMLSNPQMINDYLSVFQNIFQFLIESILESKNYSQFFISINSLISMESVKDIHKTLIINCIFYNLKLKWLLRRKIHSFKLLKNMKNKILINQTNFESNSIDYYDHSQIIYLQEYISYIPVSKIINTNSTQIYVDTIKSINHVETPKTEIENTTENKIECKVCKECNETNLNTEIFIPTNRYWWFHISEIEKLLKRGLLNQSYMSPDPKLFKNPYSNIEPTYKEIVNIYNILKNYYYKKHATMPIWLELYRNAKFDLEYFENVNSNILIELSMDNYMECLEHKEVIESIVDLLREHNMKHVISKKGIKESEKLFYII